MMLLPPDPSREEIEALTRTLGLDQPLHVQYWRFVKKLLAATSARRSSTSSRPCGW